MNTRSGRVHATASSVAYNGVQRSPTDAIGVHDTENEVSKTIRLTGGRGSYRLLPTRVRPVERLSTVATPPGKPAKVLFSIETVCESTRTTPAGGLHPSLV